jgi:hypothetical protein
VEASTVSAIVGAVSAAIAALSAYNSNRSARASLHALYDTRVQRTMDNTRTELRLLADIADATAELTTTLARHTHRDPALIVAAQAKLRRAMVVAGYGSERLAALLAAAGPVSAAEAAALDEELLAASARWHRVLEQFTDEQQAVG